MRHSKDIRDFIIGNVEEHPDSISRIVAREFGISRQAVHRHIQNLLNEGLLMANGNTRNRRYKLKQLLEEVFSIPITPDLEEDRVWRQYLAHLFREFKPNIVGICQYGFTEMVNNIVDHSEGKNATVGFAYLPNRIQLQVIDDGIGIFNKITSELGLEDHRHAILELTKGKLTTDPQHHTGEGIFFTSRMFDRFSILSGGLFFSHNIDGDWLIEMATGETEGTSISMQIGTKCDRTVTEVFDKYSGEEHDYGFKRTHVPVSLARYGDENLISRSQAKRLLARFDRFEEVLLDFEGVELIGQAFADEIFRVFRNNNPNVRVLWLNANSNVENAIKRVMESPEQEQLPSDSNPV